MAFQVLGCRARVEDGKGEKEIFWRIEGFIRTVREKALTSCWFHEMRLILPYINGVRLRVEDTRPKEAAM